PNLFKCVGGPPGHLALCQQPRASSFFQNLLDPRQTLEVFRLYLELTNRQEFASERTDGVKGYALHQMSALRGRANGKFPLRAKDLVIGGLPRNPRGRIKRRDPGKTHKLLRQS